MLIFLSMPQTLQDAVTVTRQLDVRYLWIDSFCIIQDSKIDWEQEAAMMGKVYQHAVIVLAATSATSSQDGFLNRVSEPTVTIPFRSTANSLAKGNLYLTLTEHDSILGNDTYDRYVWNSRGWTFQEKWLSTRMVHFCKTRLIFECGEGSKTEDNLLVANKPFKPFSEKDDLNWGPQLLSRSTTSQNLAFLYKSWYIAVQEYSNRDLTYESDKLSAISGLASEIANELAALTPERDEYLAGLWRNDVAQGLLWRGLPGGGPNESTRTATYQAPSWSWAALKCEVQWPAYRWFQSFDPAQHQLLRLVESSVTPTGLNLMGSISEAYIKVSGRLIQSALVQRDAMARNGKDESHYSYDLVRGEEYIGSGQLDVQEEIPPIFPVWALQVQQQQPGEAEDETSLCGLLLQRMTEADHHFRRVGVFLLRETHLSVFDDGPEILMTLI